MLVVLDTLEKVLTMGMTTGMRYQELLDQVNGVDVLDELQRHPNHEVRLKSKSIIGAFFASPLLNRDQVPVFWFSRGEMSMSYVTTTAILGVCIPHYFSSCSIVYPCTPVRGGEGNK